MKIRIKGNSIRLRLTQKEVSQLKTAQKVEEVLALGPNSKEHFIYQLAISQDVSQLSSSFSKNTLLVTIPLSKAQEWIDTELVGLEHDYITEAGESIYILVEKDFKCLVDRPREDESDHYENPVKC